MNKIKSLIKFAICICGIIVFAASCTSEPNTTDNELSATEPAVQTMAEVDEISAPSIEITAGNSANADYTEYASYQYDTDNDGEDENVVLTINAQKNKDGEFDFNDGQNWQLYIKDGENVYMLIDEYIQNGEINFNAADYYADGAVVPTVIATVDTNSMLKLTAYTFNAEKNCYTERELYNSANESKGGINKMYSTLSEVE